MAALVVLFLEREPPALSAAAQAGPGAVASPCSAAAAGGRGPEPPYGQRSLLPSDPLTTAPEVEKLRLRCACLCV